MRNLSSFSPVSRPVVEGFTTPPEPSISMREPSLRASAPPLRPGVEVFPALGAAVEPSGAPIRRWRKVAGFAAEVRWKFRAGDLAEGSTRAVEYRRQFPETTIFGIACRPDAGKLPGIRSRNIQTEYRIRAEAHRYFAAEGWRKVVRTSALPAARRACRALQNIGYPGMPPKVLEAAENFGTLPRPALI